MSCALSQRFSEQTPFFHRFLIAFGITDEIFAVTIARNGSINPWYNYGAMLVAVPLWSIGTSLGIIAGNMLPTMVVNALSVALYGMFIAIIIPPTKKNMTILMAVIISFLSSYLFSILPLIKKELMNKYPYDEKYRIYADWKFSVEAIVVGNCSFRNLDTIVADYDVSGVSANNNEQRLMEKEAILHDLFPARIIADYHRLAPIDDLLIDQSRLLTQTIKARKLVKGFSNLVLRLIHKK